jgi:hypothetical protein
VCLSTTSASPNTPHCGYPEGGDMETIRILHHHAPGYGWSFESPDIPGLTGGEDVYNPAEAGEAAALRSSG